MNPNESPVGPQQEFTDEALNAKFSYSFTRKQLIVLINTLSPIQLPVGDLRAQILIEVLDEIKRTAIQGLTSKDYKQPEKSPAEAPIEDVVVN
jgi:hypothetical protein